MAAKINTCKVQDCNSPTSDSNACNGYCGAHSQRLRRHGSTEHHPRFRKRISWLEDNAGFCGDECLDWPFSVNDTGRGRVMINGHRTSAPRAMCILAHGEPPTPEHEAAHSCGRGRQGCVNPKHLRWATKAENGRDRRDHGTLRGERVHLAKLTEEQVRYIRAQRGKRSASDIAEQFGVSGPSISSIWHRRSWAWVK